MKTMGEIRDFYYHSFNVGQEILKSILDDRDAYISAKAENPAWSSFTLEMSIFNNQALRMLSIMKHSFNIGPHDLLGSPACDDNHPIAGKELIE